MARDAIPLNIADLSAFTKSLRAQMVAPPSHVEALGMIARAAGFRNYQHLKARAEPAPVADEKRVNRAMVHFDGDGQLIRWPGKTAVQGLCLWAVWAALPARAQMSERQISDRIDAACTFRDAAQIRRAMVEHKMVTRTRDGAVYLRIEQAPPPDARALIARLP